MTPAQARLAEAAKRAVTDGPWEVLDGRTLRWKREVPTPEWAKARGRYAPNWQQDTYTQIVFLTFMLGRKPTVILGVGHAPWTGRQDSHITLKRAHEILADPAALFARPPLHPSTE